MRLDDKALRQLFLEARTHRAWLPREVPASVLKELVDLMRWARLPITACRHASSSCNRRLPRSGLCHT